MTALPETIAARVAEAGVETVVLAAADVNGVMRGKRVPAWRFLENPTAPCYVSDYVLVMDVEQNPIPADPSYTGWWPTWDTGFGDVALVPDLSTFRVAPWLPRTAVVLCDFHHKDGRPVEVAARAVLRRVTERAHSRGWFARMGPELEFFVFREDEASVRAKGFRDLAPLSQRKGGASVTRGSLDNPVIQPIRDHLEAFGIPIEKWAPESGLGQYELNTSHAPVLDAADRAQLLKFAVKETAAAQGLLATFMAKPTTTGFGSSFHLHQSVCSAEGEPLFHDPAADGLSALGRSYLAGALATLPDFMCLLAPTVNSYKRLAPGSAAGTTRSWAYENRTVSLRVIADTPSSCRIENRTPGGDGNPYLVMAAALAGGLYGMEHGLEPPPPTDANAYAEGAAEHLPRTLGEAVDAFVGSEVVKEYLGEDFVGYYAATRRWEVEAAATAVTDWERERFIEVI